MSFGINLNNGTTFCNSPSFDFVPGSERGFSCNFYNDETIENGFMPTDNLPTEKNGLLFNEPLSMDLDVNLRNPCVSNDTQSFPFTTFEELGNDLKSSSPDNAQEVLEQNSGISTENTPAFSKKRTRNPSIDTKETLNPSKKPRKDPYSSIKYMQNYREAQKNYEEYLKARVNDLFKTFLVLLKQMKAYHKNSLQSFDQDVHQKFNNLQKSLRPLNFSSWKKKNNILPFSEVAKTQSDLKSSTYYREIHNKYDNYKILLIDKLFKKINEGRALLGLPEVIEEPAVYFYEFRQNGNNKDYPISRSYTQNTNQENQKYFLKKKNKIIATASLLRGNRLRVKKDSEAYMTEAKSSKKCYINIRQKLVNDGILIPKNERYIFTKDYIFKSASFAASAILGASVAGKSLWKNESGQSIKQVESNKQV